MTSRLLLIKALVFCACLAPFVLLVLRALGIAGLSLGADPQAEVLKTLGMTGLNLLMLTLCVTPIRRATGINRLVTLRRMLGVFSFFYLALHFWVYVALYIGFDWNMLLEEDIAKRPYITVGFAALVMMATLAATSTNRIQRKLGRRWAKLHRLVYPIAILAVVHYWWQVKIDVGDPLLYAVLLAVLLGVRVAHWRSIERRRVASVDSKAAVAPTYQRVEPP